MMLLMSDSMESKATRRMKAAKTCTTRGKGWLKRWKYGDALCSK
jgi:hypothetical protein